MTDASSTTDSTTNSSASATARSDGDADIAVRTEEVWKIYSQEPEDVEAVRGVSIEVRDQGPGIPAGQLERVFERFARLDNSRSRETGGVGLGLSIVKEILRVHGGSISLRNNPAGGLVATIEIPGAGNMPAPLLGSSQLSS